MVKYSAKSIDLQQRLQAFMDAEIYPHEVVRDLIAASKTSVPPMVQAILDRCMQMHGAAGLSGDFFLAEAFNYARWCRQADGPEQVHWMALGKRLIERYAGDAE